MIGEAENEDLARDPSAAKRDPFLGGSDGEPIRALFFEAPRDCDRAVPIAVRFHHRKDLDPARSFPQTPVVARESRKVDDGSRRTESKPGVGAQGWRV